MVYLFYSNDSFRWENARGGKSEQTIWLPCRWERVREQEQEQEQERQVSSKDLYRLNKGASIALDSGWSHSNSFHHTFKSHHYSSMRTEGASVADNPQMYKIQVKHKLLGT